MRVSYISPSTSQFDSLFSPSSSFIKGGSLQDIVTYKPNHYNQRGGSIFGTIGKIVRSTIPFLKSIILPEFGQFTHNVTSDIADGIPIRKSLKKHGIDSLKNVGRTVIKKARGGGGARNKNKVTKRKKRKKKKKMCVRMKNDIFSHGDSLL